MASGTRGDGCGRGELVKTLPADLFTAGDTVDYQLKGLQSRRSYSLCMTAVDKESNESEEKMNKDVDTIDTIPPVFEGLSSFTYNHSYQELRATWQPSQANDLSHYSVEVILVGTKDKLMTVTTENSIEIPANDFPVEADQEIMIQVRACDNSHLSGYGTMNCSAASTRTIIIAELVAPLDFAGIIDGVQAVVENGKPVEGKVQVNWTWDKPTGGERCCGHVALSCYRR